MAGGSTFITDAVWWLWTWCSTNIAGARLGGIYANKPGYHNTVDGNSSGDYSVQLAQDHLKPHDKARAFDLTLGAAEMIRLTGYLQRAALHPDDNRLDSMREFYGTLDGVNVYGLIHDGPGQAWSPSTSDSSHLWHIHHSFFTNMVNEQAAMEAVASVLAGVTWGEWPGPAQPNPTSEEKMITIVPSGLPASDQRRWMMCDGTFCRLIDDTNLSHAKYLAQQGAIQLWNGGTPWTGGWVPAFGVPIDTLGSPVTPEQLEQINAAAKAGAQAGVTASVPAIADAVVDEEHRRSAD